MRVVDFKTFLTLPIGTVYVEYFNEMNYGNLCVKGKTYEVTPSAHPDFIGDYYEMNLSHPCFADDVEADHEACDRLEAGESVDVLEWLDVRVGANHWEGDHKNRYAILEDGDLNSLMTILEGGLSK